MLVCKGTKHLSPPSRPRFLLPRQECRPIRMRGQWRRHDLGVKPAGIARVATRFETFKRRQFWSVSEAQPNEIIDFQFSKKPGSNREQLRDEKSFEPASLPSE